MAIKKRYEYLDALRILAVLAVLLLHCVLRIRIDGEYPVRSFGFQFALLLDCASRFSVPLFVMISGRLMLGRGLDFRTAVRKAVRFLLLYVFWSLLYVVLLIDIKSFGQYSWKGLIVNTILDAMSGWLQLWYLFLIAGLYLAIPILDVLNEKLTEQHKRYYVGVSLVVAFVLPLVDCIPLLAEYTAGHIDQLGADFWGGYVLYFLLGYWLRDYDISGRRNFCWLMLAAAGLYTVLAGNGLSILLNANTKTLCSPLTPSTFVITVCIFLLTKDRFARREPGQLQKKLLQQGSKLCFGVYLVHMFPLEVLAPLWRAENPVLTLAVYMTVVTVVSFVLAWLLWTWKLTRPLVR